MLFYMGQGEAGPPFFPFPVPSPLIRLCIPWRFLSADSAALTSPPRSFLRLFLFVVVFFFFLGFSIF